MTITINVNGLTLCHRASEGISRNTLPDVCKTPPKGVPIPYANIAYSKDLAKGTTTVFADGGNMIANYGSIFAKSIGDEPGSMGGVKSGTHLAEADFISHSFDVFFEGKAACRLTDKMFMNHRNTVNLAGLLQPHLSGYTGNDLTMKAACEVFCTVRQEGMDAKSKTPPDKRFDYSNRARELSEKHSGLSGLAKEGKFLHATKIGGLADNAAKAAGKAAVGLDAIKSRLMKTALATAAKKTGEKFARSAGRRLIMKFIPGLNVLSTAADVIEIGMAAYDAVQEVGKLLQAYDSSKFNTYEIKPDLAKVDPVTGKPTEIYDYKFDRPGMVDGNGDKVGSYKDKWQDGQKELYDDAVGNENVHQVNNKECKCKSK
ncbi:DUF4150 domain-containing protein [Pseudaquabacterium terrae]|uniref:DUF4150 domain-containing protein n=1 Tax=Pseudaquabacterium terrae TaxID=2732868 RepID=UPI0024846A1E|nr:DUF4150 domain-containing protein [Aquabacterium terrae]